MKIYIAHSKKMDYINELYEPLRNNEELKNIHFYYHMKKVVKVFSI